MSDTRTTTGSNTMRRLSDELLESGIIPQRAQGKRLCTIKYKVGPLTKWIDAELLSDKPPKVILSWGKGVDSTAILVEWLDNPESRVLADGTRFELDELVVLVAQVGDEFDSTYSYVDRHVMPLLRKHNVRTVQICRAGASETDGIIVLEDSTQPTRMIHATPWPLSKEMLDAGTVPQRRMGCRLCTLKHKGGPLDATKDHLDPATSATVVIGYNADEIKRATKGGEYAQDTRPHEYPLIDWDWDREFCEKYLADRFGEECPKSCCTYCPFAGGKKLHMIRLREEPQAAEQALLIEHVALCLNPRQGLYKGSSLRQAVEKDGNTEAIESFEKHLDGETWAVYRVRRIMTGPGTAFGRKVEHARTATGAKLVDMTRQEAQDALQSVAAIDGLEIIELAGIDRAFKHERHGDEYPQLEEFYVACPQYPIEKCGRKNFEDKWDELAPADAEPKTQLDLF